jgi:hypothetical protein
MVPKGPLQYSQDTATASNTEPNKSNPHPHIKLP